VVRLLRPRRRQHPAAQHSIAVAAFDLPASSAFESLRASKIRVATIDLRIVAIALADDRTLLSRNSVDLGRVPNLHVEGWMR